MTKIYEKCPNFEKLKNIDFRPKLTNFPSWISGWTGSRIWYHWNRLAMGFNQTVWPNKSSNKWASCGPKFEKNPEFWPKNGKTVRFWASVAQPFMMGFGSSKWIFNRAVQTYLCQKTSLSLTLTLFSQMWKNWKFALWKINFWGFSLEKSTKIKKIIFKLITLPRAKFHIL